MKKFSRCCAIWALVCCLHARGQAIDSLIASPGLWTMTFGDLNDRYGELGFQWLSATDNRAEAGSPNITLFGRRVWQLDMEFQGEKLSGVTVSIYNRGDSGDLSREQMTALMAQSVEGLSALTKVGYVDQGAEASDAVKAHAFVWQTAASKFLLEYSFTKEVKTRGIPFRAEFIRLTVTPAEKPKSFMAEALDEPAPQAAFDGPSRVKKDGTGYVLIDSVPMVDQGQKGYCVVASAERVMRYYGVPVDEHEMAELSNASATEGTSPEAMVDSLKKLSQRLQLKVRQLDDLDVQKFLKLIGEYNRLAQRAQAPEIPTDVELLDVQKIFSAMKPELLKEARTHNQADLDHFQQMVADQIDKGVPILWSVMLGTRPEDGLEPGYMAGHMRLIIGYNTETKEIIYSDSAGPGYELERMPAGDAWTMTTAMYTIERL